MDTENLAETLLDAARKKDIKVLTAESLTAGLISATIANAPGASDVLLAGFTVYRVEAKTALLGISPLLIARYGVVSEETAKAMANAALYKGFEITQNTRLLTVAVTGIAGPTGGSEAQPVGTVCLATARFLKEGVSRAEAETCRFEGSRNEMRRQTVETALQKMIEKIRVF